MKFYELDSALQEAIAAADKPVKLKIEIDLAGHFESVFEQDIIAANFYGLKEAAGGVSSRGEALLDNGQGIYSYSNASPGTQVKVSFSLGEGLPFFQRFLFYLDDRGIQDIRGPGRRRMARLGLRDLSMKLRKTDEARDWASPAVFAYSVICDKTQPGKSLVHGIAQRAGLSAADIDCSTIPVALPYARLRRNTWAELSSLARAYRCHLECAPEKPLVFAHSPYQTEPLLDDGTSHTFVGANIFYLRKAARADLYRNDVRLKINLPVALEKQEIWRYDEPPVFYDEYFQAHYPFRFPLVREIEAGSYEARYQIRNKEQGAANRPVVYADEVDAKEEAEGRLGYDGGAFGYAQYDVITHYDKALVMLQKENDGDLYRAAIHGRPIVLDLNRSCFLRDQDEVAAHGTAALNVTGPYFSEHEINGRPQYEDWVIRELAERIKPQREYTVKTHQALFNARVGAKARIAMKHEEMEGVIDAFSLRYQRDQAFVSSFKISG